MDFLLHELKLLKGAFLRVLLSFAILTAGFMATPVAGRIIELMQHDLVPRGVGLVGLTPLDPFLAQATVAAALALMLVGPLLLWELWRYAAPGLYPRERRAMGRLALFGAVLFVGGAWFAYEYVIPATFAGLYAFTPAGTSAFYSMRDLVSVVCGMMLVSALMFELPIVMMGVTRLGLVTPSFWLRYWRHALLLALVASAIITPDGSGISMALLMLPVCGLYAAGWLGSGIITRRQVSLAGSNQ